jgi:hypothetical protein
MLKCCDNFTVGTLMPTVSHFFVVVTKNWDNLREEGSILAHGFSPWSLSSIVSGPGQNISCQEACWARVGTKLLNSRKQRDRGRNWVQGTPFKGLHTVTFSSNKAPSLPSFLHLQMLSNYEFINGLIHWLDLSLHDPITSQKGNL